MISGTQVPDTESGRVFVFQTADATDNDAVIKEKNMTVIRRFALKIAVGAAAVSIVAATLSGQTPIPVPGQRGQGARGAQGGQRGAQQPVAPVQQVVASIASAMEV